VPLLSYQPLLRLPSSSIVGRQAEDIYTGSDWDLINTALMDEDAYQRRHEVARSLRDVEHVAWAMAESLEEHCPPTNYGLQR
jgi:hypothetical protein